MSSASIETKLAVISTDVSWIRKEFIDFKRENKTKVDAEIACRKRWQVAHEEKHTNLVTKLVGFIAVLTAAISAFIGKLMH